MLAWIIGLSSGGPNLPLDATSSAIVNGFVTHKTGAIMQFLFAEGVAGLMLLTLVIAALYGLKGKSGKLSRAAKVFGISGIVACVISFTMSAIGFVLILSAAPHGTATHAKALFDLINRLDGPKMWLLGLMAIGGVRAVSKLPKWLTLTGYALAAALVVSGLSYGLLMQSIAWSVYISGILLLAWVCSFGIVLGSRKDKIVA